LGVNNTVRLVSYISPGTEHFALCFAPASAHTKLRSADNPHMDQPGEEVSCRWAVEGGARQWVRVDQPPGAKPMVSTSGRESWPSIGPDHASLNTVALAGDQRRARLAAGRNLYPCPQIAGPTPGPYPAWGCPRRAVRTTGPSDLLELFGNCAGLPVLRTLRPSRSQSPLSLGSSNSRQATMVLFGQEKLGIAG
jgi:hypothetical protein